MKILFTGDVSFTGCFSGVEKNSSFITAEIEAYFREHDYVCVNLEGPATRVAPVFDKNIGVVSSPESVAYLADKGVTHFNLANNHTFDCGVDGFIETKSLIEKEGLDCFGAGIDINEAARIKYIINSKIKVALIAVGDPGSSFMIADSNSAGVFSDNHMSLIKSKVLEAKENKSDFIVLCFHNGAEFNSYPVKYVRDKLRRISSEGVDLVVGHHPHVIQPIEKLGDRFIAYSLGNFIFDLSGHDSFPKSLNSLFLSVTFKENKTFSIDYKITKINKIAASVSLVDESSYSDFVMGGLNKSSLHYLKDNLKTVVTGLPRSKKKRLIVYSLYPIYLVYRIKSACKGNSKALVQDSLDCLKLGFIKRFIKTKNFLSKSNEF